MNDAVLVINCGSSSIKYALISTQSSQRIEGVVERIGTDHAFIKSTSLTGEKTKQAIPNADHDAAIKSILNTLGDVTPVAVGHRVVHGGEAATQAMLIDDGLIDIVQQHSALAPLHNPVNLVGVEAARRVFPNLPQVAVFDTAFHQTMPDHAYRYAIPKALYKEHGVRRYGFHGTSHAYVSERVMALTQQPKSGWLTAHLGNGCSTCAVWKGKSVDTSMGLTPLEGLVMGTRSGDIDPGIHAHLHRTLGYSTDDIDQMLNKQSGLLGVSGASNDMRSLEQLANSDDAQAKDADLAIRLFAYRAAKSLLSLSAALPEWTGIVFTGGIGENGASIRSAIVNHLQHIGVKLDADKNAQCILGKEGAIHSEDSVVQIWVVPTDEEGRIANETRAVIR